MPNSWNDDEAERIRQRAKDFGLTKPDHVDLRGGGFLDGTIEGSANYNMIAEERDRLRDELGRTQAEHLLKAQNYGVLIAQLNRQVESLKLDLQVIYQKRNNVEMERDALKNVLRRALKLPRPWMKDARFPLTWVEWEEIMADIEKALANE